MKCNVTRANHHIRDLRAAAASTKSSAASAVGASSPELGASPHRPGGWQPDPTGRSRTACRFGTGCCASTPHDAPRLRPATTGGVGHTLTGSLLHALFRPLRSRPASTTRSPACAPARGSRALRRARAGRLAQGRRAQRAHAGERNRPQSPRMSRRSAVITRGAGAQAPAPRVLRRQTAARRGRPRRLR
jgi:hypothetical protein